MLCLNNVPHIPSFLEVLKWLYTRNEKELYDMLSVQGERMLLGFAQNCRFLGIIDPKVLKVVRLLIEDRYGVVE